MNTVDYLKKIIVLGISDFSTYHQSVQGRQKTIVVSLLHLSSVCFCFTLCCILSLLWWIIWTYFQIWQQSCIFRINYTFSHIYDVLNIYFWIFFPDLVYNVVWSFLSEVFFVLISLCSHPVSKFLVLNLDFVGFHYNSIIMIFIYLNICAFKFPMSICQYIQNEQINQSSYTCRRREIRTTMYKSNK